MGLINSIDIEGISVGLDMRKDGVYLVIDRPSGNPAKVDFGSVRTLIENTGIEDWDFSAVLVATEEMGNTVETLISYDTDLKQVPESALIEVAGDKLSAMITFSPPVNGGKKLNENSIREALQVARVFMGVDDSLLRSLSEKRDYGVPYLIAKGRNPEDGKDGYIDYFFNTGKISYRPKELEDGKIDYVNIDVFQVAHKGQSLAKVFPPVEGTDGFNVFGEIIKAQQGKMVNPPVGKNVYFEEDTLAVKAEIDGQIVFTDNKISMNPVLEISGNIDNSTGNVNFLGTVVVKKNVLSGFTVTATGNVEVNGVVEGAAITCDGDLVIRGGVQGMNKAVLNAKGSITAKFMENATVIAGADVVADSVLRCNVKCGGSLTLSGKRGQLIGGSAKVLNAINANIIGSQIEASTEIQAGLDPDLFDLYMEKRAELAKLKKELTQLTQIIDTLARARSQGTLTEPKKAILVKSLQSKTHVKAKVTEIYSEIEQLIPRLTKGSGIVKVNSVVNPGVKITIGNAILYVKNKLEHCSFTNSDGEIKMGQY